MAQSFAALFVHIVFSTRNRDPLISPEFQDRLYQYLGGLCRARQGVLLGAGGMPDHVHLLVSMPRDMSVSDFVRDVKANSSKWIHDVMHDRSFQWQDGYGAFSVSQSNLDTVNAYIARQAEHHRKYTFREEFIALLKRHRITYDERYI